MRERSEMCFLTPTPERFRLQVDQALVHGTSPTLSIGQVGETILLQDEIDEPQVDKDWMRDPIVKAPYPFLPLTGDDGSEIIYIETPPEPHKSGFDPEKTEWWLLVRHWDPDDEEWPPKIVTESSDSFLSELTRITERGTSWKKTVQVKWTKQKSVRKREYKAFNLEVMYEGFRENPVGPGSDEH